MKKIAIHPVQKVFCPKCKELLLKLYPLGVFTAQNQYEISKWKISCIKCDSKSLVL